MATLSNAAFWKGILGPLNTAEEVMFSLGIDEDELRRRVFHHTLLAVPWDGKLVFPAFQFASDGQPYPVMRELLELLSGINALEIARWFGTSQVLLEDVPPRRWMELGLEKEKLLECARRQAAALRHERDRVYGL